MQILITSLIIKFEIEISFLNKNANILMIPKNMQQIYILVDVFIFLKIIQYMTKHIILSISCIGKSCIPIQHLLKKHPILQNAYNNKILGII